MARADEWGRVIQEAAVSLGPSAVRGRLVYRLPVEAVLTGVYANPSGFNKGASYIEAFAQPLYVPGRAPHPHDRSPARRRHAYLDQFDHRRQVRTSDWTHVDLAIRREFGQGRPLLVAGLTFWMLHVSESKCRASNRPPTEREQVRTGS